MNPQSAIRNPQLRGSILVGVLWCMVLLSILVIGVLHTSRMDLLIEKNYGDRVQAHYLALAGVERAKAIIYQDLLARQQSAKNHTGLMYNDPKDFESTSLGRGKFQVFRRASETEGGAIVYGISDEESRVNLNTASGDTFTNLSGMNSDILAAIAAWKTAAQQGTASAPTQAPGGANSDFYLSLRPPYLPRNGQFQTIRELLMVRGVTSQLLLGNDVNQNGFLDREDDPLDQDPRGPHPASPRNPGWAAYLTVTDTDKNVGADGQARVNPQTADQNTLTSVPGITQTIAQAIVSYRNQNRIQTLDDLLSVTPQNQNQAGGARRGAFSATTAGQNNSGGSGSSVINQDLLEQIADHLSLASGTDQQGLININTAPLEVLICLPQVDRSLGQNIINYRKSSGYFDNIAQLLRVDGMNRNIFKQVAPLVTTRSETYRITAEGKITSSGVRQRIEEIVHIGRNDIETLSYREDL